MDVGFTLALGILLIAASPSAGSRPHCTGSQVETLAESRVLRIYQSRRTDSYYVCDRRNGARVRVGEAYGSSSGYTYIGPAAAAGGVAAWQEVVGDSPFVGCSKSSSVEVRDFVRRRKLALIVLRRNGEVKELVVKRNGSLAWIEERPVSEDGCGAARTYLVRRRDARGNTVLAAGDDEPHDLRLAGSRLTWSDGTGTHSASVR